MSLWIWAALNAASVDAHLVDQPAEVLAVDAVAADLQLVRRRRDRPGLRLRADQRAVDVEAQVGAVVRGRDDSSMCSRGATAAPNTLAFAPPNVPPPAGTAVAIRRAFEVVVVVALVDDVTPRRPRRRQGSPTPRASSPVVSCSEAESGTLTTRTRPVERQCVPDTCPPSTRSRLRSCPLLPFPDASATLVPLPSSNEYAATSPTTETPSSRSRRSSTGRVAGGVDRSHLVPVRRPCGEAGVDVLRCRSARLHQVREVRARRSPGNGQCGNRRRRRCRSPRPSRGRPRPRSPQWPSASLAPKADSSRSRRCADGCGHVGLDRRLRESAVVDAHLVDQAR